MSLYSDRLITALGLVPMQLKTAAPAEPATLTPQETGQPQTDPDPAPAIRIEKDQYRLLIKMLQAIDHDCEFNRIQQVDAGYVYLHPAIALHFTGLNTKDTKQAMHLATLAELIQQPELKRPVWEKLKTLR